MALTSHGSGFDSEEYHQYIENDSDLESNDTGTVEINSTLSVRLSDLSITSPNERDSDSVDMNTNSMPNPAAGVPPQLLPHLHLVSRNRYPTRTHLTLDTVVETLVQAQKVVRDVQPMVWMLLDAPADGSLYLVWQPIDAMGTQFASDGYIWADAESAFNTDARDYGVEMWVHKAGFRQGETVATHSRKRYRLTNPKTPRGPVNPSPDPSLWIVHYSPAAPQDQIPVNRIQISPQLQQTLAHRRWIQTQGHQLVRKEFMLHDRSNWPIINFPQMQPGMPHAAYNQNMMAYQQRGAGFAQQTPGQGGGARRNQQGISHGRVPSASGMPSEMDNEEDISQGDMFDFMTPRDISKHRYRQMHEFMEEIWATPFSVKQIEPMDLGLGRKGELEGVTQGFFDAPMGANDTTTRGEGTDAAKAADLEELANRKFRMIRNDISKIKEAHIKKMEELSLTHFLRDAERRLRDAVYNPDPSITNVEPWRIKTSDLSEEARKKLNGKPTVGDINAEVEERLGRKIVRQHRSDVLSNPGHIPTKSKEDVPDEKETADEGFDINFNNGNMMDTDMDMGNTAGTLLDQFRTSNATTPAPLIGTPQAHGQDSAPTTNSTSQTPAPGSLSNIGRSPFGGDGAADMPVESEHKPEGATAEAVPQVSDMDVDLEMAGVEDNVAENVVNASENSAAEPANGSPSGWVMVSNDEASKPEQPTEQSEQVAQESAAPGPAAEARQSEGESLNDTPGVFGDTPGGGLHGLTPAEPAFTPATDDHVTDQINVTADTPEVSNINEPSAFPTDEDFGNIDNIGDELEGYDEQNQDLDLADLDHSAFGDAFHASDAEAMDNGDGDGQGNGSGQGQEIA